MRQISSASLTVVLTAALLAAPMQDCFSMDRGFSNKFNAKIKENYYKKIETHAQINDEIEFLKQKQKQKQNEDYDDECCPNCNRRINLENIATAAFGVLLACLPEGANAEWDCDCNYLDGRCYYSCYDELGNRIKQGSEDKHCKNVGYCDGSWGGDRCSQFTIYTKDGRPLNLSSCFIPHSPCGCDDQKSYITNLHLVLTGLIIAGCSICAIIVSVIGITIIYKKRQKNRDRRKKIQGTEKELPPNIRKRAREAYKKSLKDNPLYDPRDKDNSSEYEATDPGDLSTASQTEEDITTETDYYSSESA